MPPPTPLRLLPSASASVSRARSIPVRSILPPITASRSIASSSTSRPTPRSSRLPSLIPRFHSSQPSFSPASQSPLISDLSPNEYERLSSLTMDTLHDHLERLVEEYSPEGVGGWEVEYSAGVLTLSLGPHGTYVINKQPPNQQIWMSSPFNGPMRFSYSSSPSPSTTPPTSPNQSPSLPPCIRANPSPTDGEAPPTGVWVYHRDNRSLGGLLDEEVRSVLVGEVGKGEAEAWEGVGVL